MTTNWINKRTKEIVGTSFVGPHRTLAFQWEFSPNAVKMMKGPIIEENGERLYNRGIDFVNEMLKRPIQTGEGV